MSTYRLKGTSGAVINMAFPLSERLLIGRADDCDIRIDHESVGRRHAEVQLIREAEVRIRDLGSEHGTRVNGKKISETVLMGGDEIHVGNCRLMLQAPGLRPERVLSGEPPRDSAARWPWLLAIALAGGGILAWKYGWIVI